MLQPPLTGVLTPLAATWLVALAGPATLHGQAPSVIGQAIAQVGDPLPGKQRSDALLGDLTSMLPGVARSSRSGHVVLYAQRIGRERNNQLRGLPPKDGREGLCVVLAGSGRIEPIALLQQAVPGEPGLHFHKFKPEVVIGPAGHVVFAAAVAHDDPRNPAPLGPRAFGTWLWTPSEGLQSLARGGDPVPGFEGFEFVDAASGLYGVDRHGNVTASMVAWHHNDRADWRDLWTWTPKGWQLVARGQTVAPGHLPPAPTYFSVNGEGMLVLRDDRGIQCGSAGSLAQKTIDAQTMLLPVGTSPCILADSGLLAVGGRAGAIAEDVEGAFAVLPADSEVPELGPEAKVAAEPNHWSTIHAIGDGRATLLTTCRLVDPTTRQESTRECVWIVGRGERELVAQQGQPAPGTNHVFGVLGVDNDNVDPGLRRVYCNSRGQVVFQARLASTSVNDPVVAFRDRLAIWLYAEGQLVLVARDGSPLQIAPGVVRTLRTASLVQPQPLTEDGSVLLHVEWDATSADAPHTRRQLGRGRCTALVAIKVTGLQPQPKRVTKVPPAPVTTPVDASASTPPNSAPTAAGVAVAEWFGTRRTDDGLWDAPAVQPDRKVVTTEGERLLDLSLQAPDSMHTLRLRFTIDLLGAWQSYYQEVDGTEQTAKRLREQIELARKADDDARLAMHKQSLAQVEQRLAELTSRPSGAKPSSRLSDADKDLARQQLSVGPWPGGAQHNAMFVAGLGSGCWQAFAIDYRNLELIDELWGGRPDATRKSILGGLQGLANLLAASSLVEAKDIEARDWLLERVNSLKRIVKDAATFDPAKAQPIADEVLRWFASADPLPRLRAAGR